MAQNTVESIYVEYGADTSDFIQAQKGVNKSINSTTKYLNHLDKGFSDAYSTEDIEKAVLSMKDVTKQIRKNEKALKDAEFILDQYEKGLLELSPKELAEVTAQANKSRIEIDKANTALDNMQRKLVGLDSSKFDELSRDAQKAAMEVGVLEQNLDSVDGKVVVAEVRVDSSGGAGDRDGGGNLEALQNLPRVIKGVAIATALWAASTLVAFKANMMLTKATNVAAGAMFNLETGLINAGIASDETMPKMIGQSMGLALAFRLGGATASGFATGLATLLINVQQSPELFAKMGITVNANNNALDEARRILPEVVEYFNAMDPSLQKAIEMSMVFGSTFSDVNYVMMTGTEEIKNVATEIANMIDPEDIEALVEYKKTMNEVKIMAIDLATDGLAVAAEKLTLFVEETKEANLESGTQITTFRELAKEYKSMASSIDLTRKVTRELADATEDGNIRFMEQHRLLKDVRQELGRSSEEYKKVQEAVWGLDQEILRSNDLVSTQIDLYTGAIATMKEYEQVLKSATIAQGGLNSSTPSTPTGPPSPNSFGVNTQSMTSMQQGFGVSPMQQKTFNISNMTVNSNVSDMDRFIPELTLKIDEYASRIGG